jgi:hypothetical protein
VPSVPAFLVSRLARMTVSCALVGAAVSGCGSSSDSAAGETDGGASGGAGDDGDGLDGLPEPVGTGAEEGVQPGDTLLAAEARRELSAMRSTDYTHEVTVDEASGVFDYDCSGFVDYALIRVLPAHFREFQAATSTRPRAQDFVTYFTGDAYSLPADWAKVAHVADLLPGDIVAWLAVPDDYGDTGHVMLVRNPPRADLTIAGAYDVDIWDATLDVHGTDDSRIGQGNATGLGTGTIVLYADASGAPTNHSWSEISTTVDTTQVGLGRPL